MRTLQLIFAATAATCADATPAHKLKSVVDPLGAATLQSQLLDGPDHPVGNLIPIGGQTIPARTTDKGALELDLKGDGKWKAFTKTAAVDVTLELPGDGADAKAKKRPVKLIVQKDASGAWIWRNATAVHLLIAGDQLTIVDVDGNGRWNDVGVDGVAWPGESWLFPLPGADAWCTPKATVTALTLSPWADTASAELAETKTTLPECLAILKGIHIERAQLGLTPRPEDPKLSADLQKHCGWMAANKKLSHPEEKGTPGYTPEGHEAGMRSIISDGTPAERIAAMMVQTFYHRQDVIRPLTAGFGVGIDGRYGGIDGRTTMAKGPKPRWPVLCPVPDQADVPTTFQRESPDPINGDKAAGFPITAYFDAKDIKITSSKLLSAKGETIDCYLYDTTQGGDVGMNKYQEVAALIPKEPLVSGMDYRVTLELTVSGKPWSKTWDFSTGARKKK